MDSLLALVLAVLLSLLLAAASLAVLFLVLRAAVEQGVRPALAASALRPPLRELVAQRDRTPRT